MNENLEPIPTIVDSEVRRYCLKCDNDKEIFFCDDCGEPFEGGQGIYCYRKEKHYCVICYNKNWITKELLEANK